jgi:hypothetical protein
MIRDKLQKYTYKSHSQSFLGHLFFLTGDKTCGEEDVHVHTGIFFFLRVTMEYAVLWAGMKTVRIFSDRIRDRIRLEGF